jgi:hypothetical protein
MSVTLAIGAVFRAVALAHAYISVAVSGTRRRFFGAALSEMLEKG